MGNPLRLNRREFSAVAAMAGGFAIGFHLPGFDVRQAKAQAGGTEMNAWVVIAPDNTTTIRIGRPDIGQGSVTATAQFIADEMDGDWSKIKTEFGLESTHLKLNLVYGARVIAGSQSTPQDNLRLRQVGAQIRAMLVKAAAVRLNVPEAELTTNDSVITHAPSNRKLTYGEIAVDAAKIAPPPVAGLKLKEPKDWKFIGKPMRRLDVAGKVNGTEIFGIDFKLPNMKVAAVAISPVTGGTIKSFDTQAAMRMPGVRAVVEIKPIQLKTLPPSNMPANVARTPYALGTDGGVAVVADTYWQAKTALDAMPKVWDDGPNTKLNSADYDADLKQLLGAEKAVVARQEGDAAAALKAAAKVVEGDYYTPLLHHATMEPLACTTVVTNDKFEIWVGTQHPEGAMLIASHITGLPVDKGELNILKSGGGFGRRIEHDYVNQSVQIANAMKGTPVKMIWSREEDMRHGRFGYSAWGRLRAGLDAQNNVIAYTKRIAGNTTGFHRNPDNKVDGMYAGSPGYGDVSPQVIPNLLFDSIAIPTPIWLASLRGVGAQAERFFDQVFMDEVAVAGGKDRMAFERELLDANKIPANADKRAEAVERTQRWRKVLDLAAEKSGWGRPLGAGRGRGLAIGSIPSLTAMAVVVEVTLGPDGGFTLDRIVTGSDPGTVLNPEGYATQVEGASVYGLTAALYGQITIRNGRTVEGNFDDYRMLRINETPHIETHVAAGGKFFGGIGELPTGLMGPAVANAIYNAGGPRVRSLPLMNHDLTPRKG